MGVYSEFSQQSLQEIIPQLQKFRNDADVILGKIETTEILFQTIYEKEIALREQLLNQKKFLNEKTDKILEAKIAQNYSTLMNTRENIARNAAYEEGYRLLNEVGHYFNGKWQYSITLFGEKNYTFQMGINEFLSNAEFTLTGMRLKSKTAIIENSLNQNKINTIEWTNKGEGKYDKKLYDIYYDAIEYAKRVLEAKGKTETDRWRSITYKEDGKSYRLSFKDYNEGQILEGYMAYVENPENLKSIASIAERAKQAHLGGNVYQELEENYWSLFLQLRNQTNSTGFWAGPDTQGEGQIKGEGASVFEFSTIKNQLNKFITIIDTVNLTRLKEKIDNSKPDAKSILSNKVTKILDGVLANFNAQAIQYSFGQGLKNTTLWNDLQEAIEDLYS